ncbi:MAG: hypothetical protein ACXVFV_08600, partial [Mycobacteriales bacterium]
MRRWAAGLVLVALGALASPSAVPVYDGVGSPDQPYRYVGKSPAPAAASTTVAGTAGVSPSLAVRSSESGPQVLLDLGPGAFALTGSTVTVTATPLAPDGTPPRGSFDGNAYRVTASAGATLRPDATQGFLFLRAAVMTRPDPVVVHRASATAAWTQVRTTRAGNDVLSTPFRELGDYAVVRLPGAKPLGAGGLGLTRVLLLAAGVLALLSVGVLLL